MCDYELFHYTCGHVVDQLLSYCHFARSDPFHQCYGVKAIKQRWSQQFDCQDCQCGGGRIHRR
ncbi:hypothetical protein BJ878DRAFT_427273 [Calycina marina]|uniref:Uncharacterized protein n=1 Tax=Calycina marina TaxID=1763456 RepID=A0A9P8CCM7_9HELO|nr:hypothetical protein BJ878DRAFT_427273 [Calycina marina]